MLQSVQIVVVAINITYIHKSLIVLSVQINMLYIGCRVFNTFPYRRPETPEFFELVIIGSNTSLNFTF